MGNDDLTHWIEDGPPGPERELLRINGFIRRSPIDRHVRLINPEDTTYVIDVPENEIHHVDPKPPAPAGPNGRAIFIYIDASVKHYPAPPGWDNVGESKETALSQLRRRVPEEFLFHPGCTPWYTISHK
jgi:hypothetical protein